MEQYVLLQLGIQPYRSAMHWSLQMSKRSNMTRSEDETSRKLDTQKIGHFFGDVVG